LQTGDNMNNILTMDEHNYDESLPELRRMAVRGVIVIDGKLLMIEDNFGDLKIPGGGVEEGESEEEALCREVLEETGFTVIKESIKPFGEIVERRLATYEPMIWNQISHIYFCDVEKEQGECHYSDNEKAHGFKQVFYTLDEAISKNEEVFEKNKEEKWCQREYQTLLLIKKYFEKLFDK